MFRILRSIPAIALLATGPAWAQVYKWVDDKGVVNYSSRPPTDRKSALLDPNSVPVSTYAPQEGPAPGADTAQSATEKALAERIASLERKLDAERYARQRLAISQAAAADIQYERCLLNRRIDCDSAGIDPYPYYAPAVVVFRPRRHARPPRTTLPVPPLFVPPRRPGGGISGAGPTPPSGIRRPHGRTGGLL
jgi:hypothetical protein